MATLLSLMTLRKNLFRILTSLELDNNFSNIANKWDSIFGINPVNGANDATITGALTTVAIKETKVAMPANDINLNNGTYFTYTATATATLTVSNVAAAGQISSFVLDITNGGTFITWWSGIKWSGGAPILTASGRDLLGFITFDGGTTWTGVVLGKDFK